MSTNCTSSNAKLRQKWKRQGGGDGVGGACSFIKEMRVAMVESVRHLGRSKDFGDGDGEWE